MAFGTLREMCETRRPKFGTFVCEFVSPGFGHILKAGGCDYAFLDMEHSGFGFDTLKAALRYLEAAELPAFVRVPSRNAHHIARALDMGAEGVMLPMVGTAAEAARIVRCVKYPPHGERGVALQVAHDRYRPGPVKKALSEANRRTCVLALIETAEGVANAEAIAAVGGIDCLWIGHFDLTQSLGIPGRFDHPDYVAAVAAVGRACKKHKKSFGRLVPDVETGVALYHQGFDFICLSGDVWLMQGALAAGIQGLDEACRPVRRRG